MTTPETMTGSRRLQLLAQDAEDLQVISAALQDAVAKIGDMTYEPQASRLTIAVNRYRWEGRGGQRVRAALQIGGVLKVQSRRLRRDAPGAVVELLSVTFEPGEEPGGWVVLNFAGDADLKVEVECLDAVLADMSDPWPTPSTPKHYD
jgi:hypothetical protein